MSNPDSLVAHQFNDAAQQREAATLGMWVFLATEILFFGGMFCGYTVYRVLNPEAFREASQHTLLVVGTINTAVLLLSSFVMVLAVRAAQLQQRRPLVWLLLGTAALGSLFLAIKGFEYAHEIREGLLPAASFHLDGVNPASGRMFFFLYFLMTGVHGLHVLIGVVLLVVFAVRAAVTKIPAALGTSIDLLGLYWHLVDVIWVFLFPLLYLLGRNQ